MLSPKTLAYGVFDKTMILALALKSGVALTNARRARMMEGLVGVCVYVCVNACMRVVGCEGCSRVRVCICMRACVRVCVCARVRVSVASRPDMCPHRGIVGLRRLARRRHSHTPRVRPGAVCNRVFPTIPHGTLFYQQPCPIYIGAV